MTLKKKEELRKNRLDMEFQSLSQRLNAILILATAGVLSFLGVFIWYEERRTLGFFIITVVLSLLYLWYYGIKNEMDSILKKIEKI